MPKNGTKAILKWNAYNGPDNNEVEYSEENTRYDTYHVYIKYGTKFNESAQAEQLKEARESFDGIKTECFKTVDGTEFETGEDLKDYQLYKIEYTFPKEGLYFFSIWASRDDHWYGPTYYPGVKTNVGVDQTTTLTSAGERNQGGQEPVLVDINQSKPSTDAQSVNVYGLTSEDYMHGIATGTDGSPGGKSLGRSVSSLNLVDKPSPSFIYTSSFHDINEMQEIRFDVFSRATVRKQSGNSNTPSKDIYFEITGQGLLETPIVFPKELNSIDVAKKVAEQVKLGENYYMEHVTGFAATALFTEDVVPLRNFDFVVEAYVPDKNTSAGNKVHDGVINENEGSFENVGYDIVEVNLLPPSGLMVCDEYNDRESHVTPQKGYDKKLPYIAEAKITDKGAISMSILESIDSTTSPNKKYLSKQEIFRKYFEGVKGCVIYYSDEAFTLNPGQISISENGTEPTKQKVTVNEIDIDVNRGFVLRSEFSVGTDSVTFPFAPFADQNLSQSHVIVGFFDELMRAKHFYTNNVARTTLLNGKPADTILGEKNLQFSKIIRPLDTIDRFDPKKHLSKQPASTTLFKKSPIDEGAKALSYRAYCYISATEGGESTVDEKFKKGISDFNTVVSSDGKEALLTLQLKENKDYIPVVNYYEKSGSTYRVGTQSNTVEILTEEISNQFKIKISNPKKIVASKIFIGFISSS
jgi:hypothetical protein